MIATEEQTRDVPTSAMQFRTEVQFAQTREEAVENAEDGAINVSMLARGNTPIEHYWWGRVIHDFAGMVAPESIIIDYMHADGGELLGSATEFEVTEQGLWIRGSIWPQATHERVQEIAANLEKGMPYEASIDFVPSTTGLVIEEVQAGTQAEVNGEIHDGPITVIRKWPLRAVAIVPGGADDSTSVAAFSKDNSNTAKVKIMAEEQTEEMNEEPVEQQAEQVDAREEFAKFLEKFGAEKAAEYFGEGLSFEDAVAKHCDFMEGEVKKLQEEREAEQMSKKDEPAEPKTPTGADPAQFGGTDGEEAPENLNKQELKLCKQAGVDPKQFAARKRERAERRARLNA